MIVRARMKVIEDLPPDIFCCNAMRTDLETCAGLIWLVYSNTKEQAPPAHCRHCKTPAPQLGPSKRSIERNENGRWVLVPIAAFEFDEGEYNPELPLDVVSYRTDAKGKVIIGYDVDGNIRPR